MIKGLLLFILWNANIEATAAGFSPNYNGFAQNSDLQITMVGPILVANKSKYLSRNNGLHFSVYKSNKTYQFDYKHEPQKLLLTEVMRAANTEDSNFGYAQTTRLNSNQVESYSLCAGSDWSRNLGLSITSQASELLCATATKEVCAELGKIGALNVVDFDQKMATCQTVAQTQSHLAQLTKKPEYLKARDQDLQNVAASYESLLNPNPNIRDKILDSNKVQPVSVQTRFPFNMEKAKRQTFNMSFLFRACQKFAEMTAPKTSLTGTDQDAALEAQ